MKPTKLYQVVALHRIDGMVLLGEFARTNAMIGGAK
jgi:hypothetical protein